MYKIKINQDLLSITELMANGNIRNDVRKEVMMFKAFTDLYAHLNLTINNRGIIKI